MGDIDSPDSKVSFNKNCTVDELKYHKLWDWLMPVVEKIGEIIEEPEVLDGYTYIMIYGGQIRVSTEIEGVFHDVVDIIKRYNENN